MKIDMLPVWFLIALIVIGIFYTMRVSDGSPRDTVGYLLAWAVVCLMLYLFCVWCQTKETTFNAEKYKEITYLRHSEKRRGEKDSPDEGVR